MRRSCAEKVGMHCSSLGQADEFHAVAAPQRRLGRQAQRADQAAGLRRRA